MKKKSILAAALCGAAILMAAAPVYAAPEKTSIVTFRVGSLPKEVEGRTVICTVGKGPSDSSGKAIVLSELNGYEDAVELEPGIYYFNASLQYDPIGEYPLREENDTCIFNVTGEENLVLTYTFGDKSTFQSITGEERNDLNLTLEETEDVDPDEIGQIGAYLTVPEGFDQRVIVSLGNRYTGKIYRLELYSSNQMAAFLSEAESGKYECLDAFVVGDDDGRYEIFCEDDFLHTDDGATFHLTVTDMKNRDRKPVTPRRDIVEEYPFEEYVAEEDLDSDEELVVAPKVSFFHLADLLPVVGILGLLFYFKKRKEN